MPSLLEQAVAAPMWELPVAEDDSQLAIDSMEFVTLAASVAETLSRVGRPTITWQVQSDTWGLTVVDGTVRVASPEGETLTWIPGTEVCIRIAAPDKLDALERARQALATLTAE